MLKLLSRSGSLLILISLLTLSALTNASADDNTAFTIPRTQTVAIQDSDRSYELYIKLPKGYSAQRNKAKRYPVIYITDAMYAFQIVSGATRFPMNSNKIQQAILVGISWQNGLRGDKSRVRDFTPSIDNSWKKQTGGADRHIAFLQQKILPYMQQYFRTDPKQRTFVGNSLGGLLGGYILAKKPAMFRNYVLGSPSFWWDKQMIFEILKQQQTRSSHGINANVFIGIGALEHNRDGGFSNFDMVGDAQQFKAMLDSINSQQNTASAINSKLLVIDEASHETAFPTSAIQGLYWIFNHNNGVSKP